MGANPLPRIKFYVINKFVQCVRTFFKDPPISHLPKFSNGTLPNQSDHSSSTLPFSDRVNSRKWSLIEVEKDSDLPSQIDIEFHANNVTWQVISRWFIVSTDHMQREHLPAFGPINKPLFNMLFFVGILPRIAFYAKADTFDGMTFYQNMIHKKNSTSSSDCESTKTLYMSFVEKQPSWDTFHAMSPPFLH